MSSELQPTPPRSSSQATSRSLGPPPPPRPPSPPSAESLATAARTLSARLDQERHAKRSALATNVRLLARITELEKSLAAAESTVPPAVASELAETAAMARREAAARAQAQAEVKAQAKKIAVTAAMVERLERKLDATRKAYNTLANSGRTPGRAGGRSRARRAGKTAEGRPAAASPRAAAIRARLAANRAKAGSDGDRAGADAGNATDDAGTVFLTAVPPPAGNSATPVSSASANGVSPASRQADVSSPQHLAFLLDREAAARARDKELIASLRASRREAQREAAALRTKLALLAGSPLFSKYLAAISQDC
ncbi:uncharacterized protein AMSG_03020 [Thecamonas trahens ATCC 50062]|uniref:Uncharacterized protein n=1 Tax=Thecamonas trahens ATCC 50062 TaxID=461836 RepID=A0A0L0D2Q8_THETB|nr:hypothetical protein AMSG_03020 [Thecamonas trahens ATCC 50062]KNC46584.1 hypothetical protein AMSG_03020 [Thecamonas trahens ATCC 50062]|eukprot:XP_013760360.1 hypothetical protein AMSG_03020 [Thecamonas trahens ATCC 50062]